ncbi:MAG: large subunit ribosomal protein L10 [Planctomycetota bacterium]|jgi:large subunit ribosomal protein L10
MPNLVTEMTVRTLTEDFDAAEGMVLVTFGGLDVATTQKVRNDLAEKGATLRMVRNRLARRVLSNKGYEFDEKALIGNTAIAFGSTEAVIGAAKVLTEKEVKQTGKVKFMAGVLEGVVLNGKDAAALAKVPDRPTLQAQLLGVISGPARALASVINAVPSATARVIQARADELEKAEG